MGPIGMQEMMLIFLLALLLFGPKKLPELGKLLGKGLTEFRRAKSELTSTFESHLHELERETRLETEPKTSTPAPDYSSPHYPYPYDEYGQHDSSYSSSSEHQETTASHDAGVSESSTASATATQDAEANREHAPTSSPVAGTVPRSNGIQSVDSPSTTVKEEHSA